METQKKQSLSTMKQLHLFFGLLFSNVRACMFTCICLLFVSNLNAQVRPRKPLQTDEINLGTNNGGTGTSPIPQNAQNNAAPRKDTIGFEHRDDAKDSIKLSYRYLGNPIKYELDSSIHDFDLYFSVPSSYANLGNNGSAANSLIYMPVKNVGFDPGFHAFDVYRFTLSDTRYYKTTKPFTALSYQLASGKEQMLKVLHTQNPNQGLNLSFDFRLISAPGLFATQNNNHNSFRISGHHLSKRKRYGAYFSFLGNNLKASQNGGVVSTADLSDPNLRDRFAVPVTLGNKAPFLNNPFSSSVTTGNLFKDQHFFIQQHYDVGKRDSVAINDSTTEYLFYPKLRFQHKFSFQSLTYQFVDFFADSLVYQNWYAQTLKKTLDSFQLRERWSVIENEFSVIHFPDTKNTSQFIEAGAKWQNVSGAGKNASIRFDNLIINGIYRNRTRNKKWDLQASTSFHVLGENNGDYKIDATIQRQINKKWGEVSLFFSNVNRSPARIYNNESIFNLDTINHRFLKENNTSFGIRSRSNWLDLSFQNHFLLNTIYFKNQFQPVQFNQPINIIQLTASKKFSIKKNWKWYSEVCLQQTDGASPIRVPLFYSRNRFAFEGRFFRNLILSTGLEVRYASPYRSYGYSPVLGQFTVQDTMTIRNRPDVAAFFHFRIRGFSGYLRAENLNTLNLSDGISFTRNNFAAPMYPTQGFMIRFGIQWWYVN